MNKPIIFALDDDPQVLRAVTRDLKARFRSDYKILSTVSPKEALDAIAELKKQNEEVALFLVDQRMPDMLGVEFLAKAKDIYPNAKKVLLTAYSDTNAAIMAINEVQLDYYLSKPWHPPEEKLYPILEDQLDVWQMQFVPPYKGIKVVGYQYSPLSHEIKDYLSSNLIPYKWFDIEKGQEAADIVSLHDVDQKDLPLVILETGEGLVNPSISELASNLGFSSQAAEKLYDVVIIGAGPSGLAAAVYGGSEGLKTLLIEKKAPGGQAGSSSRIENYLGFPNGLSGQELAHRAITQAKRFGIEFLAPKEVVNIELKDYYKVLTLNDGNTIQAKSIIISTGVNYRRLPAKGIDDLSGAGIYYGSSMSESQSCQDKEVYIVGGGNSAGQAAVYLSNYATNVYIVIRREDLTSSMSSYLIDQINAINNIHLVPYTNIREAKKENERLVELTLETLDGDVSSVKADALFVFIGSKPYTDWINVDILKNHRGFIETGNDLSNYKEFHKIWKMSREPYLLETCIPGIFAAGDVRSGAMNRVASAVGEGSMAIKFVHEYLAGI